MKDLTKLLIFLISILLLVVGEQRAFAGTVEVCPACPVKSIKAGVKIAKPGDQVVVNGGTYKEYGIEITKRIHLLGKNNPVLDGAFKGQIISVLADGVVVQGFTIKNIATSYTRDDAAIRVVESNNVKILQNTILNTYFGVYLQNSDNSEVRGNVVTGKDVTGLNESSLGNAIHLWQCNKAVIVNNKVRGHRDGIYLEFVKDTWVKDNLSQHNLRYGLHFMFSDGNVYTHNTFRKNGAGVAVMYTSNIVMERNTFEENWGPASYGLLLKDIRDSKIRYNTFSQNTTGIYMEGSSRLDIQNNSFTRNGWAVRLLSSCTDNVFTHNNFTENSFDIGTNGNSNLNQFEKNYWDKYTGYDLNRDKVGDVPYRPVSLYSMLVEKVPSSVMFMRSFMVDLLDNVEKVLPTFIPDKLIDERPLMRRIDHDYNRKFTKVIR
ncbi:nitrous oxide reductase family maturation protein NosD [Nibribacter koreensis]|uniref:Nitrous oxide reductase family maturation protein NosD n=1 Tax=Nibribacter koreensis TaxID=1084519 RepID=A0ABP8FD44_9BACT